MLSQTSPIRAQVEEARVDLLRWIRKRWMGIRQEGGFDTLEGWSIKEISQGAVYFKTLFRLFTCSLIVSYSSSPCYIFLRDRSPCRGSYLTCTTSHPTKSTLISCFSPILDSRVRRCRLGYTLRAFSPCFCPLPYRSYLKVP